MNFFERQQAVRAQSRRLILLFVLAVAGIVFVVDLSLLLLLGVFKVEQLGFWESLVAHRGALAVTSVLVLAIIGVASLGRMLQLRGGGAAVARELGGTQVPGDTRDPGYRRLRNVVEEVAIASALPVPDIFVLEQEAGINAFAAGWSASDAAIA
ncbi:MAG: peptidase M48 Ste24p, partial [Gammaproteobacteria bacterium HGW-Gammaproteobacteria-6]